MFYVFCFELEVIFVDFLQHFCIYYFCSHQALCDFFLTWSNYENIKTVLVKTCFQRDFKFLKKYHL